MNDKEAFEKWMKDEDRHDGVFGNNNNFTRDEWIADKAWQAACAYKKEEYSNIMDAMTRTSQNNAELQGQLKSCIVVYEEQKDRLIKKLEVAVEALTDITSITRRDGNDNEYEGAEAYISKKALKKINED